MSPANRTSLSRRAVLAAAPVAAAGAAVGTASSASAETASGASEAVLDWFDTTDAAVTAAPASTQVTNSRTWAVAWLAAARAVRRVPHGLNTKHYRQAALAAAVHRALSALAPTQQAALDAALESALGAIPDGRAKRKGVTAGVERADGLLAERAGDGLDPASVSPAWTPPAAAPGVWQPTPPAFAPAAQAGTRFAVPFALDSADQFRLDPPPAIGTPQYRADLDEVYVYGGLNSTARTQAQTDTAQFWLGSSFTLYNPVLRAALEHHTGSLRDQVELVALFHVAAVDTQIATSDSKYAYLWWRPVTAIAGAVEDGDPATVRDPSWTPLHNTPAHPDYPSGHNTYSGSAEEVLTQLVGDGPGAAFTIPSPSAPGVTRTYTTWHPLTTENVDARVWSGIHSRSADLAGVELSRNVAAYVLSRAGELLA
ncbi:vanadium-dependent haloperoxidase [Glycomyces terrestris]|uniref:Phosphoesterase PA-phosphatase n=1 Tax=Glycomyces terrestris TaxID=2493553 RepID=A0A426V097_9ACTN|nr:vanadium-dependent haloperoxidase [Glycomyces terrestris]RRS00301.1 phosphoesterase PA-phosphatase [Glycomyces terrestris]